MLNQVPHISGSGGAGTASILAAPGPLQLTSYSYCRYTYYLHMSETAKGMPGSKRHGEEGPFPA